MLKQIVFLVWICAAALGGAVLPKTALLAKPAPDVAGGEAHDAEAEYNYGETELMSAPVVMGSQVEGYVLGRFAYATGEAVEPQPGRLNPATLLADAFTLKFSEGLPGAAQEEWAPDVDQLAKSIQEFANRTAGAPVFAYIYVTQLDYLAKDEVRSNSAARREALRTN